MSQLVRLRGTQTAQCTHCAVDCQKPSFASLRKNLPFSRESCDCSGEDLEPLKHSSDDFRLLRESPSEFDCSSLQKCCWQVQGSPDSDPDSSWMISKSAPGSSSGGAKVHSRWFVSDSPLLDSTLSFVSKSISALQWPLHLIADPTPIWHWLPPLQLIPLESHRT